MNNAEKSVFYKIVKKIIRFICSLCLLLIGIQITIFLFSDSPEHVIDKVSVADEGESIFSCENGMSEEFYFKVERDYVKSINIMMKDQESDTGSFWVTLVYADGDIIYSGLSEVTQASEHLLQYDIGAYMEKGKECYLYVTPEGFDRTASFTVTMLFGSPFNMGQALIRTFLLFGVIATAIFLIWAVPVRKIYLCFTNRNVLKQVWCIAGIFLLFGLCAFYYGIVYQNRAFIGIWILVPLMVAYLYAGLVLYHLRLNSLKEISWRNRLKRKIPIILLLLINAGLRLPMLGDLPIWDGGEYFGELTRVSESFRFSANVADMLWNFRLVSHSTIAWAMFGACGIFIAPTGVTGILLVYLILTLCAIAALQRCFLLWNPRLSETEGAVCALFVSVTPLFLGTFSYIYPDYGMAVFFIFMIAMFTEKKYLLAVFWAIATTQTKEPGIVLVLGYFIFHILKNMIDTKGNLLKRLKGILYDPVNWCALWTGIVYALYLWRQNGLTTWAGVTVIPVKETIAGESRAVADTVIAATNNYFGINPEYMIYKLKQYSILNFSWIYLIIIILYFGYQLYGRIRKRCGETVSNEMQELFGAYIGFVLLGILFVTHRHSRYHVVVSVILAIGSAYCFSFLYTRGNKKKYMAAVSIIIILLFGGQSFASIDLISNQVFDTAETGKGKIVFTDPESIWYGDGLVNNYQFNYLRRVYSQMLRDCDYNGEITLINCGKMGSVSHINGSSAYSVGWDLQGRRRVLITKYTDMAYVIPIQTVYYSVTEETVGYGKAIEGFGENSPPPKAILYFPAYYEFYEADALRCLSEIYDISEMRQIEVMGGTLKYYECIRKQEEGSKGLEG